jgi:hypothetical protein
MVDPLMQLVLAPAVAPTSARRVALAHVVLSFRNGAPLLIRSWMSHLLWGARLGD